MAHTAKLTRDALLLLGAFCLADVDCHVAGAHKVQVKSDPRKFVVYNMAARAGGNLPSDLPQAPALGGATQAAPGSLKKRKRSAGDDEQGPPQRTGLPTCLLLQLHVTSTASVGKSRWSSVS